MRRQNPLFCKIFKMRFFLLYNPIFLHPIFCIIQYPMLIVPMDRLPLNRLVHECPTSVVIFQFQASVHILMRWSCSILIMHCFVHLHGTFKVHCRRSRHFFRYTFPHSLWGCVTCFTIKVGNSSSNSKQRILQIIHIKRVTLWNLC